MLHATTLAKKGFDSPNAGSTSANGPGCFAFEAARARGADPLRCPLKLYERGFVPTQFGSKLTVPPILVSGSVRQGFRVKRYLFGDFTLISGEG